MTELPEIKTDDIEKALSERVRELYDLTGGKSSFSEGSVGVMLLELLTCVLTEQQRSMAKVSGGVLRDLCALYGYAPQEALPARAYAAADGGEKIPAGTKLRADSLVFETQETVIPTGNRAAVFARVSGGKAERYHTGDGRFSFEIFDGSDRFVIGFEKPFAQGRTEQLLMCFDSGGRKIPADIAGFDAGTEISWQYYGSEGGKIGWHDMKIISDATYGCFCTGVVTFEINGAHAESGGAYPICAVVKKRGFDRLPVFCGAYTDICAALQLDRKCSFEEFGREEFEKNAMFFGGTLAGSGVLRLFVRTGGGWVGAESLGVSCAADRADGGFRLVTSSRRKLAEMFAAENTDGPLLLLVSYEHEYVRDFCTYASDGTCGQRIPLNFAGVCPGYVEILAGGENGFERWRRAESLSRCGAEDRVFAIEGDELVFGDNSHGMALPSGEVVLISLALTAGARGNIPAGEFSGGEIHAQRPAAAVGGKNAERPAETFARVLSEPTEKTLLSERDFIECAKGTPGVLIRDAEVYLTENGDGTVVPNAVTVVVHPDVEKPWEAVSSLGWYISAVKRRMERLCAITLALSVRFPKYAAVDVSVRVRSDDYYVSAENNVRRFFEDYFGGIRHGADKGALMRELSALPGVAAVNSLVIRCSSAEALHQPDGGVSVPIWCRLYLHSVDVRCEEY